MEEANLGRVDDPAAGSWFLDARTRDLAAAGWAELQRIEAEGGLPAALLSGAPQTRIAAARAALEAAMAEGRIPMVGITKFVDPDVRPAGTEPTPIPQPATGGDTCEALTPFRLASANEEAAA